MENGLELFHNPEFGDLRVFERDGEAWFIAKEVCDYLGTQTRNVRAILEEDEVVTSNVYNINIAKDGQGGKDMLLISEAGFYSLLLKARGVKGNPERSERIRRFKRWVTHDVLPTLRQKGSYGAPQSMTPDRFDLLSRYYEKYCNVTGVQLSYAMDRAWKRIEGISPLAIGGVRLSAAPDDDRAMYVTVTEIGKLYGKTAMKLNPILTSLGLQTCTEEVKKNGKKRFIYMPTELGVQHGGKRFSDSAKGDLQREVWNLFWHKEKLPAFLDEHLKRRDMEPEVVDTEVVSGVV